MNYLLLLHTFAFRVINMNKIQLIHGECLEEMSKIPDNSIDAVICDLPYGTTACKWDSIIPLDDMWIQLSRVTKEKAAILLFGTQPFSSKLISSNYKMFKYDYVWCKSKATDFLRAKLKPMGGHEYIMVFSKSSCANGAKINMNYYPQGLVKINKKLKNHKNSGGNGLRGNNDYNLGSNNVLLKEEYIQEFKGYPNTKLFFNSEQKTVHPTQKPVSLIEYLIKTYTKEGEVVLDFTMGSGTTGVACKNLNRSFIGIELDDKYFHIAQNRINNA